MNGPTLFLRLNLLGVSGEEVLCTLSGVAIGGCSVKYRGIHKKDHTTILFFVGDAMLQVCVGAKLPKRTVAPFPLSAGAVLISPIVLPTQGPAQVRLCRIAGGKNH